MKRSEIGSNARIFHLYKIDDKLYSILPANPAEEVDSGRDYVVFGDQPGPGMTADADPETGLPVFKSWYGETIVMEPVD